MRRGGDGDISSLDLLLDTICNAFGGVVFIALLLAVLTQSTSESIHADVDTERRKLERLRKEQQAAGLAVAIEELQEQIETRSAADSGDSEERVKLFDMSFANASNETLLSKRTNALSKGNAELDSLAKRDKELEREIGRVQRDLKRLSVPASRNKDPEVTRRLPKLETLSATKIHQWMAIFQGKLFALDQPGMPGRSHISVREVPAPNARISEPIIELGQPIVAGCEERGLLAEVLELAPSNSYVIRFFVDLDSFAEFNYVKEVVVERGFRYMFFVESPPYYLRVGTATDAM